MSSHRGNFKQYIQFLPAVPDAGPLSPADQGEAAPAARAADAAAAAEPAAPAPAIPALPAPAAIEIEERPEEAFCSPPPRSGPAVLEYTTIAEDAHAGRGWRRLALAASLLAAVATGALGAILAERHLPGMAGESETAATVADLQLQVAALKATTETMARDSRTAAALAPRLERTEKSQAEAAARIGKLESGVEKKAAATPPTAPPNWADITGSIGPRPDTVPAAPPTAPRPILDGWVIRDAGPGVALVEHRSGRTLFEVTPGIRIPGLGRIEAIERRDGRLVIVTQRGLIVAPR